MKKLFFTILIFCLGSKISFACDLTFVNFGDKPDKFLENQFALPIKDDFDGETIIIPSNVVCPNNKSIENTMIEYLFVDNQMVLITLMRAYVNDTAIMDFTINKYGKFNLPKGKSKKDWFGSHTWEIGNNLILYVRADTEVGPAEVLEISNVLYLQKLYDWRGKVAEWSESQQ